MVSIVPDISDLNNMNVTVRLQYLVGQKFSSIEHRFVLRTSNSQNAIIGNTGCKLG
jgi:hypothetical protein